MVEEQQIQAETQSLNEEQLNNILTKFPNLSLVDQKLVALPLSKIRNKDTDLTDFRKYSDRVMRLLIEQALAVQETKLVVRESPLCKYVSTEINESDFVCVTILRAGNAFIHEMLKILPGIQIGMILIQRDESTKEKSPLFYYSKLPKNIEDKKILLCDPMLATGGTLLKAIEEANIKEENITFLNLICWETGLKTIFDKHPKIKIITGSIDPTLLQDRKYLAPGLGDFGCRYYGSW